MKTELKAGDWVSSRFFEGVKQIAHVDNGNHIVYIGQNAFPNDASLTLVCGFVKGEEVCVSDYENFESCRKEKFVIYIPEVENPFITTNEENVVTAWTYARPIPKKEYKAYSEPKLEWIGKKVKDKFGVESTIRMIGSGYVNFKENNNEASCEDLFKNYTWLDGSICGDNI